MKMVSEIRERANKSRPERWRRLTAQRSESAEEPDVALEIPEDRMRSVRTEHDNSGPPMPPAQVDE